MIKRLPLLAWLAVLTPAGFVNAQAAPDSNVGGAQFSLVKRSGATEKKLDANQPLKGPSQLRLYVKALNQPCTAIITGFRQPGGLNSENFPPQVASLAAGDIKEFDFNVSRPFPATQVYVTILTADAARTSKLVDWAKRWKANPYDDKSRRALHQNVSECYSHQDKNAPHSGPLPDSLAGVRPNSAQASNGPQPSSSGGGRPTSRTPTKQESGVIKQYLPSNWTDQADFMACSKQAVYIYSVTMSAK